VSKGIYLLLFANGSHLWKKLALRRYDSLRESEGIDWKFIFQSRNWAEKVIKRGDIDPILEDDRDIDDVTRPRWKLTGDKLLGTIRDMLFENGIRTPISELIVQTLETKVTWKHRALLTGSEIRNTNTPSRQH
jgi:hypothetical protein